MKSLSELLVLFFVFGFTSCQAQPVNSEEYTFKSGDPNGIGKWYMGREIAHVMGFHGMEWLERSEREDEEKTAKLLTNMNISPNDCIADVGAGSGYHVFRMADMADQGQVYAVDIQDEMLKVLQTRKDSGNYSNVKIVKGSEQSVNLHENTVDKILMVDVYHEFNFPKEMLASMILAMKADGALYLIEYRREDAWVPIKEVHKMTEAQAVKEMEAAGMKLERNIGNLPWQHCMVFRKK